MAIYAVATIPLIKQPKVTSEKTKQVWYTDDATASGQLQNLKTWWNELQRIWPRYGYFPNPNKTWLIVKEEDILALQLEQTRLKKNLYKRKFMNGSKSCYS